MRAGDQISHPLHGAGVVLQPYEDKTVDVDFSGTEFNVLQLNCTVTLSKSPTGSTHKQDRESKYYWPYPGHERFFRNTNFMKSLAVNPYDCWWLVGYLDTCGRAVEYDAVHVPYAGVQQRGRTLHNSFPDPCKLALDQKVGEFFDTRRVPQGFVQINSVHLFEFLDADVKPVAPPEYQASYQEGRVAGEQVKKQDNTTAPQF